MSLLREIQTDAVNSDIDLAVILRKAKVLAVRLKHGAFKQWVDDELNGYPDKKDLPSYRVISNAHSLGHFVGFGNSQLNNAPIPPSCLPEEIRDLATVVRMTESVSALSELVKSTKKKGVGALVSKWPVEAARVFASKAYTDMQCVDAWRVLSAHSIAAILDTVRNRILSFVLEIEEEAPNAGEAEPGVQPLPEARVNQVFNTYILGGNVNVASGNTSVSQTQYIDITEGDAASLNNYLASLGLGQSDLQQLEVCLKEDKKPKDATRLGPKIREWIGRMTTKAANSGWKISADTAVNVLTKAICKYYGLEEGG